ncbi:DNA polymerase III subunit chi [Pseudomonas sp. 21LCFQ02]|uniref:DNA polymerase III subunit chi n=1 Tax=unclassified Pseudomonas TaxID=196821 RepID=UPI002097F80C|nr:MULTISPECIES: DNA polymerase III subunit chi [unclassified Pseudomonas]MCO8161457.1 DNA polymerase III subunit chi [Pseudomonas sp. 21LCFQ010]MCO8168104.1 DNA polymerase III subunit chi [Pseudomonas sp. 21LCFQ02]MCQ9423762.1 DNA polymerase III subunit chi [Pseudomonas sp. LJDD11]
MDTSKKAESAHLLDDLESIRKLLGDENLQPPLLTETVHYEEQIPLLFDVVESPPQPPVHLADPADAAPAQQATAALPAAEAPTPDVPPSVDALLHLDSELRSAAQLIMQDVISDFAPHIETEIKRRLEARLERLLASTGNKN